MRIYVLQALSVLLLVLAVVWFVFEPGFEPVITAVAGLVGLFSAEFMKPGSRDRDLPLTTHKSASTGSEPGESSRKSIVVLPFDNLSPDSGDAYFADGLTEEIITHLSCCGLLRVISRNSAMALKDTRKDTRTIGRELSVQCVLEGSVRRAGDDLRITAQLIDAETDTHLWAKTYEGTIRDVFEIQEEVARSIVGELQLELRPEEERRLTERPIDNPQAYDCYLRARYETEFFAQDGYDRAIEHLQAGLELVGENSALLAGMGYVYFHYSNIGLGEEDYADKAEEYAQRALVLDPESAEAHLVLGCIFQAFRGNPRLAFHHLRSGLRIKPDDAHLLYWTVIGQYAVGKSDSSHPLVERLQQVDPLSPYTRWLPAGVDLGLGRFEEASDFPWYQLPKVPHFDFFHSLALTYAGRFEQAQALIGERTDGQSDDLFFQMMRVLGRAIEGEAEPLLQLLSGTRAKTMERDPVWAYYGASFCALVGLEEKAMEWVSLAADRGFFNYPCDLIRFVIDLYLLPYGIIFSKIFFSGFSC